MGGFLLHKDGAPYQVLCPNRLSYLLEAGAIDFPLISSQQIADKGQTHPILTATVFVQVAWFFLQIISRVAYHLPVTQLEVVTALLVIIQALTLSFWWSKPLDTRDQYRIDIHPGMDEELLQSLLDGAGYNLTSEKYDLRCEKVHGRRLKAIVLSESPLAPTKPPLARRLTNATLRPLLWISEATADYPALSYRLNADAVPNGQLAVPLFYSPDSMEAFKCLWNGISPAILGIAHLYLGHHFATHKEEKIWRVASIVSASGAAGILLSLGILIPIVLIEEWIRGRDVEEPNTFACVWAVGVAGLCLAAIIASRSILIVEALLSLRMHPTGALLYVRWTNYIIHMS